MVKPYKNCTNHYHYTKKITFYRTGMCVCDVHIINSIADELEVWRESETEVFQVNTDYSSIFTGHGPLEELEVGLGSCNQRLSEAVVRQPFNEEQVVAAAFKNIGPTKAPGPQGFHALSSRHQWGLVGSSITESYLHLPKCFPPWQDCQS